MKRLMTTRLAAFAALALGCVLSIDGAMAADAAATPGVKVPGEHALRVAERPHRRCSCRRKMCR